MYLSGHAFSGCSLGLNLIVYEIAYHNSTSVRVLELPCGSLFYFCTLTPNIRSSSQLGRPVVSVLAQRKAPSMGLRHDLWATEDLAGQAGGNGGSPRKRSV